MLGWAIEHATGKPCAELVSAVLWQPMGAETDAYVTLDRQGLARCAGGVCATVRDLARLGQLIVNGGRRRGRQVIPLPWIDDLAKNGDRQAWTAGEWARLFPYRNMSCRSGWYVVDDAPAMVFAMGIYGQNLFVDVPNRLIIAKLSSQAAPVDPKAWALTHRAIAQIRHYLLG